MNNPLCGTHVPHRGFLLSEYQSAVFILQQQ